VFSLRVVLGKKTGMGTKKEIAVLLNQLEGFYSFRDKKFVIIWHTIFKEISRLGVIVERNFKLKTGNVSSQ